MSDGASLSTHVISVVIAEFERLKQQAEQALAQLADEELFFQLNPDQNSVSVIMKHLTGNMLSRWTDFRTSDGEKPDRNRDEEFIERPVPRDKLFEMWQKGWTCLLDAMKSIGADELERTIAIRGERMSLFAAINRQTAHYGYHVGQIGLLAKHIRGSEWKYITIPRGQSEQYNEQLRKRPDREL